MPAFAALSGAREELDAARQRLGDAEEALAATSVPNVDADPWGMPELWQSWWCLRKQRIVLQGAADVRGIDRPGAAYYYDWKAWALAHRAEFRLVCSDVVAQLGEDVTDREKTYFAAHGGMWLLFHLREAVEVARAGVSAAETQLQEARVSYEAALQEELDEVVQEIVRAQGDQSRQVIRTALGDAAWALCARQPALVKAAAAELGLLPENPGEDLYDYWWVTRPDEFVGACEAAYAQG